MHVRDISLSKPYSRVYFEKHHWCWNEQSVLQGFLAFNRRYELAWPATYMATKYEDRVEAAFGQCG